MQSTLHVFMDVISVCTIMHFVNLRKSEARYEWLPVRILFIVKYLLAGHVYYRQAVVYIDRTSDKEQQT